ncbi:hypothetical protein [Cellulomonas sp. URHD0024]|uniref:hypothetical protein n=1 Tax=Cellulomonas sp. URHD0024 TaxID=1302620 RepID=UPI000421A492|nr:hypothetical protein [Cellulomonas sp. URHD0024]
MPDGLRDPPVERPPQDAPAAAPPDLVSQPSYGTAPEHADAVHAESARLAALDAMHQEASRRQRRMNWVLAALGAVPLIRGLTTTDTYTNGVAFGFVALFVLGGLAVLAMSTRVRHRRITVLRPGCEVVDVWGSVGLRAAVAERGVTPSGVRANQPTSLCLVATLRTIEVWRGTVGGGPVLLVALPWTDVSAVEETDVWTGRLICPGFAVRPRDGKSLEFAPRTGAGGVRALTLPELHALVGRLEGRREGSLDDAKPSAFTWDDELTT